MKKTTSIVFTGDIGFDRYMDRKWEDEQLLSEQVLEFFQHLFGYALFLILLRSFDFFS